MTLLLAAVLAALLAVSCASLRRASGSHSSTVQQDSLIAAYVRSEVEKGLLTLRQTTVEFYPPAEGIPVEGYPLDDVPGVVPDEPLALSGIGSLPEKNDVPPPNIRNPTPVGAVKRITRTELSASKEQSVTVDSSTASGSQIQSQEETESETEKIVGETPSETKGSRFLKALAAVLGLLILGYGIVQYRINALK